jgi:hypothetical protein
MRRAAAVLLLCCGPSGPIPNPYQCKDYLACDAKTAKTGSDATYGAMGTCFQSTQSAADACNAACTILLDSLKMRYPDAGC